MGKHMDELTRLGDLEHRDRALPRGSARAYYEANLEALLQEMNDMKELAIDNPALPGESMKGEIIDPRIRPGALIRLNQRTKYVPYATRSQPGFDIEKTSIPVWTIEPDGRPSPYDAIPSGSIATVIERCMMNDVTKLKVLVNGKAYHCYGVHADLLE